MFSKSLARAANRTCAAVAGSSNTSTAAAQRTTQCLAASRQPHQRRHSSSKASSCPPDNTASDGKPAPTAKAVAGEKTSMTESASPQRGPKKLTRAKRSRMTAVPDKQEDQFAGLPAVPGMHMQYSEFSMSNFFSLHRPLSLATTIPPPSSADAFDSIFESRKQRDPWENGNSAERRPEDVVYALRNLFDDAEPKTAQSEEEGVRWEVIQEQSGQPDGVKHLDGSPRLKTLEEMVAQFRPFEAPPPPQPFPEDMKLTEKKRASKPKQKRYATTIFLTESTSETGQTTYTASTSPIVRIPEEQAAIEESTQEGARSGYRDRMQRNQRAYFLRQQEKMASRPTARAFIRNAPSAARLNRMLLISVKRQRKLKMKKHKYKKLMKRTRNLRRRQDRA